VSSSVVVVDATQFYAVVRVKDAGWWQGALQHHLGTTFSQRISQQLELVDGDLLALSAGDTTQAVSLLNLFCRPYSGVIIYNIYTVGHKKTHQNVFRHNFRKTRRILNKFGTLLLK